MRVTVTMAFDDTLRRDIARLLGRDDLASRIECAAFAKHSVNVGIYGLRRTVVAAAVVPAPASAPESDSRITPSEPSLEALANVSDLAFQVELRIRARGNGLRPALLAALRERDEPAIVRELVTDGVEEARSRRMARRLAAEDR